ncbi:hypothetical protein [Actinacidiphila soli]|uniref:hypothetical protein n=1 Tax=Actinacidiphila soli TaxID=2487275 RepID=UPI000FCB479F|nr:hypothetical protein [Actinacidiphila soli]
MTSGNGAERSGEEPAVGPIDGSTEDSVDGEDTTVDPAAAPAASADRPCRCRRKAGVEYRPV